MPRYYFHVVDGRVSLDTEGTELADLMQARVEAIRTAGEILRREGEQFWKGGDWRMTVADANARTVFTLDFSANNHGLSSAEDGQS